MNVPSDLSSLDRAELEYNKVLEQIGRIFAASKGTASSNAIPIAHRLKQLLPMTTQSYHNALDEIDQQLQLAKSIMRRDLAVLRHGSQQTNKLQATSNVETAINPAETGSTVKSEILGEGVLVGASDTITDDTTATQDQPDSQNSEALKQDLQPDGQVKFEADADGTSDAQMTDIAGEQQALTLNTDSKPVNELATAGTETTDKAPNTAFSTNADLDSLFNDPLSATGQGEDQNGTADTIDFGDTGNDTGFDFDVFNTSLGGADQSTDLPELSLDLQGLTDGANSAEGEPDFSALFGDVAAPEDNALDGADQINFNFDQLMDLDLPQNDAGGNADTDTGG